jgi:splicing factor U2AF subunit
MTVRCRITLTLFTRIFGVRCASMARLRNLSFATITMIVSPYLFSCVCVEINKSDLIGNVYARFKYEDSAQTACDALNSRWYAGRPIYCELSPVTDFREACCRLNSGDGCVRGGFCNFIHRKQPSPDLDRELTLSTKKWLKVRGRDARSMTKSASPEPSRKRF